MEGLVSLLADDVEWSMPPYALWYSGVDSIAELLRTGPATWGGATWSRRPTVNRRSGCYLWEQPAARGDAALSWVRRRDEHDV